MAFKGGQYTLTASAVNLTTALALSGGDMPSGGFHCKQIDIYLDDSAANPGYIGPSTVTNVPANARGKVMPGRAWSYVAPGQSTINTDEVYVVGTANAANIIFVVLMV